MEPAGPSQGRCRASLMDPSSIHHGMRRSRRLLRHGVPRPCARCWPFYFFPLFCRASRGFRPTSDGGCWQSTGKGGVEGDPAATGAGVTAKRLPGGRYAPRRLNGAGRKTEDGKVDRTGAMIRAATKAWCDQEEEAKSGLSQSRDQEHHFNATMPAAARRLPASWRARGLSFSVRRASGMTSSVLVEAMATTMVLLPVTVSAH